MREICDSMITSIEAKINIFWDETSFFYLLSFRKHFDSKIFSKKQLIQFYYVPKYICTKWYFEEF